MTRVRPLVVLVLLMGLSARVTTAQPVSSEDPFRFLHWPIEDARAFADGLTSPKPLYAAGLAGALLLLVPYDETMVDEVRRIPNTRFVKVVEEIGNVKAIRPTALMLFIGAAMSGDTRFQDAAFTSLQSVFFANVITNSLKFGFGRARPYQEMGARRFEPFSGNTSFPSGHATTAFAFVTPWLLYYPNYATPVLLVLGAGTAFTRMVVNFHWFTDIAAGSLVGFTTAYWLTRRHQEKEPDVLLAPTIGQDAVGASLQVRF